MTRQVGIRALKNEASALVREVEAGSNVVITRNGRAVARIVPDGIPAELTTLMQQGQVSWNGHRPTLPARVQGLAPDRTLAEVVIDDRGPR